MISKTSFKSLKYFFVRILEYRISYYCKYHVELIILKDGLNTMRLLEEVHIDCNCESKACGNIMDDIDGSVYFARHKTYRRIIILWQLCIYEKVEGEE